LILLGDNHVTDRFNSGVSHSEVGGVCVDDFWCLVQKDVEVGQCWEDAEVSGFINTVLVIGAEIVGFRQGFGVITWTFRDSLDVVDCSMGLYT
jgi:hypothetical protein